MTAAPLLVGEIFVDYTVTEPGSENKLRLGGLAHAARGLWSLGVPFGVAVILPEYLRDLAFNYLRALGCLDFRVIGCVRGAPNIMAVFDATETGDQGYENLLHDEKTVELVPGSLASVTARDVLIFPGSYDLVEICTMLPSGARLHLDVAYDFSEPNLLKELPQNIETILISTSSPLFQSLAKIEGLSALTRAFNICSPATLILKENRGGARITTLGSGKVEALPAQLGATVNSVGVGDVFAAAYVALADAESADAAWRATYVAAAYSQTTYPDLFKTYVQRDLKLTVDDMRNNWGVFLPWERRRDFSIYLAAPDFSYSDRHAIDRAIASLEYHNFRLRRPIVEIGELPIGSDFSALRRTFNSDYRLLKESTIVFAIPTGRDPGTLVEIGIAIEAGIPVVVYDSKRENVNTMVMAGAKHYSTDLDVCLNAIFTLLSQASAK